MAGSRAGTPSSTRLPLSRRSVTGACWACATEAKSSAEATTKVATAAAVLTSALPRRAGCLVCILLWCPKRARGRKREPHTFMLEPTITRHPHGTYAVDTEYVRPGLAAAHIVEHRGRAAFIDVGTTLSVPYLLAALDRLGIAPSAVDLLLLTHVHLDHAGGAGALMQALPNAKAVLHPRGAPHLIDP